jgi:hypothetical protein
MVSFPVPDKYGNYLYKDLKLYEEHSYLDLMRDLGYKFSDLDTCHLDPDISKNVIERHSNWRPLFGQAGAAQGHLDNQNISEGDLFLFFGWFAQTKYEGHTLRINSSQPGKHIIFGYLQVGEKLLVGPKTKLPEWITYHPHTTERSRKQTNNTIYVAAEKLSWNRSLPGSGMLRYSDKLVLTNPGSQKSIWALPSFLKDIPITYHTAKSWNDGVFRAVSRGQEFVISANTEVMGWTKDLIT